MAADALSISALLSTAPPGIPTHAPWEVLDGLDREFAGLIHEAVQKAAVASAAACAALVTERLALAAAAVGPTPVLQRKRRPAGYRGPAETGSRPRRTAPCSSSGAAASKGGLARAALAAATPDSVQSFACPQASKSAAVRSSRPAAPALSEYTMRLCERALHRSVNEGDMNVDITESATSVDENSKNGDEPGLSSYTLSVCERSLKRAAEEAQTTGGAASGASPARIGKRRGESIESGYTRYLLERGLKQPVEQTTDARSSSSACGNSKRRSEPVVSGYTFSLVERSLKRAAEERASSESAASAYGNSKRCSEPIVSRYTRSLLERGLTRSVEDTSSSGSASLKRASSGHVAARRACQSKRPVVSSTPAVSAYLMDLCVRSLQREEVTSYASGSGTGSASSAEQTAAIVVPGLSRYTLSICQRGLQSASSSRHSRPSIQRMPSVEPAISGYTQSLCARCLIASEADGIENIASTWSGSGENTSAGVAQCSRGLNSVGVGEKARDQARTQGQPPQGAQTLLARAGESRHDAVSVRAALSRYTLALCERSLRHAAAGDVTESVATVVGKEDGAAEEGSPGSASSSNSAAHNASS